jgi:hypothetical protein
MLSFCLQLRDCRRQIIGGLLGYDGAKLRDPKQLCNNMCDICSGSSIPEGHERFAVSVFPLANAIIDVLNELQQTQPAKASKRNKNRGGAVADITLLQLISAVKTHPEVGTKGSRPHVSIHGDLNSLTAKVAIPVEWSKDVLESFCGHLFATDILKPVRVPTIPLGCFADSFL